MKIVKQCPFCGEPPDVSSRGTWIEISCCACMGFQKSDFLTIEERETWDDKAFVYSEAAEEKAMDEALGIWNKRI